MINKVLKLVGLVLLILLSIKGYAAESADAEDKARLRSEVLSGDYAGLFQTLGLIILDDVRQLKPNQYYTYLEVVKVVESYKGDLPEYIYIKGESEYTPQYNKRDKDIKRYIMYPNNGLILMSLCKSTEHYYAPQTHGSFSDTEALRKTAKEAGQVVNNQENLCNQPSPLAK